MKIIIRIFLILSIIVIFFINKDILKNIFLNSGASNVVNKIEDVIKSSNLSVLIPNKKIETPGPLRALDKIIPSQASQIHLSIFGVIDETNRNRKEVAGLPPLVENKMLDTSAQYKLKDMFDKQYFEHISPTKIGVSDLAKKVGYEYIIIGENLALGNFADDKALVDAWMASPGHRANILNKRYTEIGVAVGHGMFEGHDVWLAVQHFGLPKSSCPSIDQTLYKDINDMQKTVKNMSADLASRKKAIDGGEVGSTTLHDQIDAYNKIVSTYNSLVKEIKNKVTEYNAQVKAFNNCAEAK